MKRLAVYLLLPLAVVACQTTETRLDPDDPEAEVTIKPDEMEPLRSFLLDTRRIVAAEFIKIECSQQFFERQMGFTRDPAFVRRTPTQILEDGTKIIRLDNVNKEQTTNIDPDLLPRVYFGLKGLEVRAYRTLVIFIRPTRDRERPLFLTIDAKGSTADVRMWVSGRLQHEKPRLSINSALLWKEDTQEYVHRSSIG